MNTKRMKVIWQIVNSLAKSGVGVRSLSRSSVSAADAYGNYGVLIRTLEVTAAARDLDLLRAVMDYVAVLAVLWRMEMMAVIKNYRKQNHVVKDGFVYREAGVELLAEIAESEEANVSSRKSKGCARSLDDDRAYFFC